MGRSAPWVGRVRLVAVAMFVLGIVLSLAASATAEVTPGCSGSINGQSVEGLSSTSASDAIPVKEHTAVPVAGQSPSEISHLRIKMELAGSQWTVRDAPTSGTSWQNSVPVDQYAKHGVGLYKVIAESTGAQSCVGAALVNVEGNPLGTTAGVAATAMTAVGTVGMFATSVVAARESAGSENVQKRGNWNLYDPNEYIPETRGILQTCGFLVLPALLLTGVAMMAVGEGVPASEGRQVPRVGWKPRISFVGLISGLLLGLGTMVLAQQYAIVYPTRILAITWLLGGILLVGVVLPSLFRILGVGRVNRRLAELARSPEIGA